MLEGKDCIKTKQVNILSYKIANITLTILIRSITWRSTGKSNDQPLWATKHIGFSRRSKNSSKHAAVFLSNGDSCDNISLVKPDNIEILV